MKLNELRDIAKAYGLHANKLPKAQLIGTFQASEGNSACFASAYGGECDQVIAAGVSTVSLDALEQEHYRREAGMGKSRGMQIIRRMFFL